MHTRLNPRAWSLARQLFALQVVVVAVVVLAAGTAAYFQDGQRSQDDIDRTPLAAATEQIAERLHAGVSGKVATKRCTAATKRSPRSA